MRLALVTCVVAGCGRFGFDPSSGSVLDASEMALDGVSMLDAESMLDQIEVAS